MTDRESGHIFLELLREQGASSTGSPKNRTQVGNRTTTGPESYSDTYGIAF